MSRGKDRRLNIKISFFCVILSFGVIFTSVNGLKNEYFEDNWLKTLGIIVSIKHEIKGGINSTGINNIRYEPKITYKYFVDDVKYQSSKHSVGSLVNIEDFPEGKEVPVYYNSKEPRDSVLVRTKVSKKNVYVVYSACFLAIIIMVFNIFRQTKLLKDGK